MEQDAYNWISQRAHEIWRDEGCPDGRDREHWSRAVSDWEGSGERVTSMVAGEHTNHVETVLVVDDEPLIRFATVDALEQAGFEVLEAGNADEAFVILQNNDVDVVFTDVNMPGSTDGLGLARQVRANYPDTRVVVTSGHVRLGRYDLAAGVSFIPKPYDYDVLIRLLRRPGTAARSGIVIASDRPHEERLR